MSAPKFSSFRKPQPPPPPPVSEPSSSASTRNEPGNGRSHVSHRHKRSERKPSKVSPAVGVQDEGDLFLVDRRGDVNIVNYGSNSKYSIPTYRPPAVYKTIGGSTFSNTPQKSILAMLSREERSILRREPTLVNSQATECDPLSSPVDFVPLSSSRKRKRDHNSGDISFVVQALGAPSDLQNELLSSSESFSESDSIEKDTAIQNETLLEAAKKEHARLAVWVRESPQDAQAWRHYIAFQEEWLNSSGKSGRSTAAYKRSLVEIRLSLYADALSKFADDHPARTSFILQMLNEGSTVWEKSRLASKWDEVVSKHPENATILLEYLNFRQSDFASFSFDACRKVYQRYIALLGTADMAEDIRLERRLYAVLRFTAFASDAGYVELAMGIWQALLEMCCGQFVESLVDAVQQLEEFWDSEEPRIGDTTGHESSADLPRELPLDCSSSEWYSAERFCINRALAPRRTDDEDADPNGTIIFSDLEPFVFGLNREDATAVVNAFLCFCNLPALPGVESATCGRWWHDPYIRTEKITIATLPLMESSISTTRTLFMSNRLSALGHGRNADFVQSVTRKLARSRPDMFSLSEYYLALVARTVPKLVKKEAKALIKAQSSNTMLYSAYALSESVLGHSDTSIHILDTALKMNISMESDTRQSGESLKLKHTRLWQAIQTQDKNLTSDYLSAMLSSETAVAIYSGKRDEAIRAGQVDSAVMYCDLLVLCCYLRSSSQLPRALEALRDEVAILSTLQEKASYAIEVLFQTQAYLISHHIRHISPHISPAIRELCRTAVKTFPNNTILIDTLRSIEQRDMLDDRMRHSLLTTLIPDSEQTILLWILDVTTELRRFASNWTTVYSVRSVFEQAVGHNTAMHNETVWTAYIRFEAEHGDKERAKALLYRGIAAVPWCKRIALLAFEQELSNYMTPKEMRSIYKILEEKELRLHSDWPGSD